MTEPTEQLQPDNTAILSAQPQTNLGVWLSWLRELSWLRDLGGSYEILTVEKSKRVKERLPQYELDPEKYYRHRDGSIRRISQKGLEIAEKLGI